MITGGIGDDRLVGGTGNDRLFGGDQNDGLMGGPGDDNDELMGMDGNDNIDAGAGHDMIAGGKGDDTISGGPGADAFIVDPTSGNDVVLGFEATGEAQGAFDHLALQDILPNQVSVSDTARGALVSWDTNGDGTAEGSLLLVGVATADLRQSDFILVQQPGFVAGMDDTGSHYIFA